MLWKFTEKVIKIFLVNDYNCLNPLIFWANCCIIALWILNNWPDYSEPVESWEIAYEKCCTEEKFKDSDCG